MAWGGGPGGGLAPGGGRLAGLPALESRLYGFGEAIAPGISGGVFAGDGPAPAAGRGAYRGGRGVSGGAAGQRGPRSAPEAIACDGL